MENTAYILQISIHFAASALSGDMGKEKIVFSIFNFTQKSNYVYLNSQQTDSNNMKVNSRSICCNTSAYGVLCIVVFYFLASLSPASLGSFKLIKWNNSQDGNTKNN